MNEMKLTINTVVELRMFIEMYVETKPKIAVSMNVLIPASPFLFSL